MLTGGCGGAGGGLPRGACPQPRPQPADPSGMSISASSADLVTHIIRYCNSPVEYDVSYVEGKYNMKD
jgi:hypothetical protein